jgi:hypothetical protein
LLIVGTSAANDWPTFMSGTSYRPNLLFQNLTGAKSFYSNAATTDTSIMKGSLAGSSYGPDQAIFEEPEMQKCIAILTKAGIDVPAPKDVKADPSNMPYQAAFQACPDVALMRAVLEAAGSNLNYGTVGASIDGLKVKIPGDPTERTYGPPPASDGNPSAYLYTFDTSVNDFVLSP